MTDYTVNDEGVYLPQGQTFVDGGHVNVHTTTGSYGVHFEALNDQPSGQWIGQNFLPWSAFGIDTDTDCVTWVQVAEFNYHYGENGETGIGTCTEPTPSPSPSPSPSPTPVLECPAGTVPGWLDESGNPTSCVGDDPQPTPIPTPTTEVPATPNVPLAETGPVENDILALIAAGLIVLGVLLVSYVRRNK